MRRMAGIALIVVAATVAEPARGESLVTDLSTATVKITSNFTGADVTLFGTVEKDGQSAARLAGHDVIVVLRGPDQSVVARRKERVLGIFVNRRSRAFKTVPAFYEVLSNRPVDDIVDKSVQEAEQLTIDTIDLGPVPWTEEVFGEPAAFRAAFLRLKREAGLFRDYPFGVSFLSDRLFRADLVLPENTPVGEISATVYLFNDGELLTKKTRALTITKTGFESIMTNLAQNQAWFYGLATVVMALMTGWIGGVVFRRD